MSGGFLDRIIGRAVWRFLLGVLAAGVGATLAGFPAIALVAGLGGEWEAPPPWEELWPALLALLPFGVIFAVLGGLPVHLALALLRRQGFGGFALGGALAGAAVLGGLLNLVPPGQALRPLAQGALIGLAAGLAFRAVWRPYAAPAASGAVPGP